MIEYKNGDVLKAEERIICQSVNYQGVMGAGLSRQIKNKYPGVMEDYIDKIETFSFDVIRSHGIFSGYATPDGKIIASIFGQNEYATSYNWGKKQTDYLSLGNGLVSVRRVAQNLNPFGSIAIPFGIGCGLGGGDWELVEEMIKNIFEDYPHLKVFIYKLSK